MGARKPLEKVIHSQTELEFLMQHPALFRNAIAIAEPWEHVGKNPLGEDVRASLDAAYIAQKIGDLRFNFISHAVFWTARS